ncbi:mobile element transfer protein [Streptomyces sp. GC420]|uniref:mobile element transfer protein n=1 Tax=Streptomyces sp. GC420 TaxID=2697568 RepID=UPI001414DDBD|nr:mobile element transfer protein [Streptomyces sp. GC420]NBM16721.1 Mobile element transfer [Streptomyces sp. GC420]
MPPIFRNVRRIGPVRVASYLVRGRVRHLAACTAPNCDFTAEYDNRAPAELAARTHRCSPR